jgi:hypothetical protein
VRTPTTKAIHRDGDGELLGLLVESDHQWLPATVFGGPLASPTSHERAENIVRAEGLASLAESWWVRLPGRAWQEVWFLEVHADRARVNDRNPTYGTGDARWITIGDVELRRRRPADLS